MVGHQGEHLLLALEQRDTRGPRCRVVIGILLTYMVFTMSRFHSEYFKQMISCEQPDSWLHLEPRPWVDQGLPHECRTSATVPGLGRLASVSPVLAPESSECLEELLILRTFLKYM